MPTIGQQVQVKPAREELSLRMPDKKYRIMAKEGDVVTWSRYYNRLHRDGDLLVPGHERKVKTSHKVRGGGVVELKAPKKAASQPKKAPEPKAAEPQEEPKIEAAPEPSKPKAKKAESKESS